MDTMMAGQLLGGMGFRYHAVSSPVGVTVGDLTKRVVTITCTACIAMAVASAPATAQHRQVKAYVVMTPNGPATCATWVQWRAPGANPMDREFIQYWSEGYISGLAAGSRYDIVGLLKLQDLGAWIDRYCSANPQTKLPLALNALGQEMIAHSGGKP